MMFSIGNHLALRVPFLNGTDAADMLLETPCATELLRNARGVLSGEQRAQSLVTPVRLRDFNAVTARSVGGYRGTPYARVSDPGGLGLRVNHTGVTSGPEPLVQFNLYGGAKQGYLSPEPWFGIQNSLNTRRGLVTLEPGREWQWTVELVPETK